MTTKSDLRRRYFGEPKHALYSHYERGAFGAQLLGFTPEWAAANLPVPGYSARESPLDEFGCLTAAVMITPVDEAKRKAAYDAVPEEFKVLYDPTAYDVAYEYLLDVFERGESED